MPRAKAKSRHTTGWWAEHIELSPTTRARLVEFLDLESPANKDKADAMLQHVEKVLGQAKGMETALDDKLRPANVLSELAQIQNLADQLIDQLDNISPTSKHLLQRRVGGVSVPQLRRLLDRTTIRIELEARRLGKRDSRHAPVKRSIREL